MAEPQIMIVTGAPAAYVDDILDAIAAEGGGSLGNYTHCAFTNAGQGRFLPNTRTTPHQGIRECVNIVNDVRIETFCALEDAKAIVHAIRQAHPYEEPVIYLIPLLSVDDLP